MEERDVEPLGGNNERSRETKSTMIIAKNKQIN